MARDANAWIDREIAGCRFADERLGGRLRTLLAQMAGAMGGSIPLACQDWANTKAAYRFFSNDRVSEGEILAGHFLSTRDRAAGVGGPLMVLHDTTEFSYRRRRPERVGQTCRVNSGKDKPAALPPARRQLTMRATQVMIVPIRRRESSYIGQMIQATPCCH